MAQYEVRVTSTNRRKAWRSWWRLRRFGLRRQKGGSYRGVIRSDRRARKLRAYCEKVHLHFQFWNAYGKRGSSYRKAFFDAHAPIFGDYYFCAYCGRLVRSDKVSVDHLYPVGRAGKSVTMQKLLKKKHFSGVNDPRNLVASCRSCNQKKGKQMGAWLRKGRIGRHQWVWLLRWSLRFALIAALVFLFYKLMR